MSEKPTLADVIGELSGGTFERTALEMLKMVALGGSCHRKDWEINNGF